MSELVLRLTPGFTLRDYAYKFLSVGNIAHYFRSRDFRQKCLIPAFLLACGLLPMSAQAVVFDWNAAYAVSPVAVGTPVAGTSSAPTSYECDANHNGNDLSITLSNAVGNWGTGYPQVSTAYNGGYTTQKSFAVNFATETSNTAGLTIKIDFNYTDGVKNVSFQIFDVDYTKGTWIDQIDQIWAISKSTGAIIGPTSVTGTSDNYVTGSGTNYVVTGTKANAGGSSSAGNVSISFGDVAVTEISFRWKNIDAAKGDQKIALGDISYTDAGPEVGSSLGAVIVCGIAFGFYRFRRRKSL